MMIDNNHEAFVKLEQEYLSNPKLEFQQVFDLIQYQLLKENKKRVKFVISNGLEANATSSRRSSEFKIFGYIIKVNKGFYYLINDLAGLITAQSCMITNSGEFSQGTELSEHDFLSIIKESVSQYLNGSNNWTPNDHLGLKHDVRLLREYRIKELRRRSALQSGMRFIIVVFVILHEMGHIFKGHFDTTYHSKQPLEKKREKELEADVFATEKFIHFIIYTFPSLVDQSGYSNGIKRIFSPQPSINSLLPPSLVEIQLAAGLMSIAALFTLFSLIERAAGQLNIDFDNNYPSAKERYNNFRDICLGNCKLPETHFTNLRGGLSPADEVFERFTNITTNIKWK